MRNYNSSGSCRRPKIVEDGASTSREAPSLQMELELLAIRAKNQELTKAHAKLVHDLYALRNENDNLRAQLIEIQAKYSAQEAEYAVIKKEIEKHSSSLLDVVNLVLLLRGGRPKSLPEVDPKPRAVTHTVKPHNVNGTILNHPRIALTRMANVTNKRTHELPSCSTINENFEDSVPSTSNEGDALEDSGSEDEEEINSRVSVARRGVIVTPSNAMEDDGDQLEDEQELTSTELENRRLSTINEESFGAPAENKTTFGEVKIYLSRLSNEELQASSQNNSCSSLEANANDTYLNIEATVIENEGNRVRTDIMIFSPRSNSTRLEQSLSSFEGRTSSACNTPQVQNSVVTPRSLGYNNSNENEFQNSPSIIPWYPTPSMSALGDIDQSVHDNRTENQEKSPMSFSKTPSSIKRPRTTWRQRSTLQRKDSSPLSVRSSNVTQRELFSLKSSVNLSDEGVRTPTVFLQKLESPTENASRLLRGVCAPAYLEEADEKEPDENVLSRNVKAKPSTSRKAKSKSRSRSPKSAAKKKRSGPSEGSHSEMRDVQIRLSNIVGKQTREAEVPENKSGRPERAAKPKNLKEASLLGKMRREN
ncbi:micronuclear linker histone polyprotein-like isoform X2 [Euwallacea fornicatus]|uniref:micronuclear linker histone polyprotein-like isoform X2 n=1 Tax=Euwallacea fornicatus TaxID=995702 RepID=UPI00338EAC8F